MAFDSARLSCPTANWIGIKIADWTRYEVRCRSRSAEKTESRRCEQEPSGVEATSSTCRIQERELQDMLNTGWKREIQCLSIDDLCDRFLADKTG
jgi:hypothetical protein